MGKFIDLTGKKFERLTVLEKQDKKGNEWRWKCLCDCGNECLVTGVSLRTGGTRSCGCLKKESDRKPKGNAVDMLGKTFYHLTVIERAGSNANGQAMWKCKCDCGNPEFVITTGDNLRRSHTRSCGCERRSHGEQTVAKILQDNNIPFIQEKVMFKYSNKTNAKFDFYVDNKYLVEYDGETHYKYNMHGWHNEEQLKAQQERDMIKNQWCKDNNIPLIRIPYTHLEDLCIEDLLLETSQFII